jgi:hypothetical protein
MYPASIGGNLPHARWRRVALPSACIARAVGRGIRHTYLITMSLNTQTGLR